MKTPYSPTDNEKHLALRHIWFEIREAVAGWRLTAIHLEPEAIQSTIRNAALLSSHVHWRILADFFSNKVEMDNVLASHYGFMEALTIDPEVVTKINKTFAHLTYHRTKLTEPEWTYKIAQMGQPVLERCALFIRHLLDHTSYVVDNPPDRSYPWEQRVQWEALYGVIFAELQQIEAGQERKPGTQPFSSTLPGKVTIIPGRHPREADAIVLRG